MHKERRRGQWSAHHDQVPATYKSGAAGNGLNRYREWLKRPFNQIPPHSPFFVRASIANKQKSTAEARSLGGVCVFVFV